MRRFESGLAIGIFFLLPSVAFAQVGSAPPATAKDQKSGRPEAAPGATGWSGGEAGVTRDEEKKSSPESSSPTASGLDPTKPDGDSKKE